MSEARKKTVVITRGAGSREIDMLESHATQAARDALARRSSAHLPLVTSILDSIKSKGPVPGFLGDRRAREVPAQEMGRYRSLLGVSNQFTEFVVSAMLKAGMRYPDGQEALAVEAGLDEEELVDLLGDRLRSMKHLYALIEALPEVRSYFGRRAAYDAAMAKGWDSSEDFARHREREGLSREEQAAGLGMTEEDLASLERGEFSPSIDEYERIVKIPEFSRRQLAVGIPEVSSVVRMFAKRNRWRHNKLASQVRIPINRLFDIMDGKAPNADEVRRLRNLMPDLPSWREVKKTESAPRARTAPPPSAAPAEPEPSPQQTTEAQLESDEDESEPDDPVHPAAESANVFEGSLGDSVPISLPAPSARTPIASEYPTLEPHEKVRIEHAEYALVRLCSDVSYKRPELFPDDADGERWQLDFLRRLQALNVVRREGERNFTRYVGVRDRAEALLGDPLWLLRLLVPAALARVVVQDRPAEGPSEAPGAVPADVMSEVARLLPQYYEVLSWQHQRIQALEEHVASVNDKLGAIMTHLGVSVPETNPAEEEDESNG